MIQKKVVEAIYRKYKECPTSVDELDIPLLFEKLPEDVGVEINSDNIVLNSVDWKSPFHIIPVKHIHAILDFDEVVALVMHSSILFISKEDGSIYVHIKEITPGVMMRLRHFISGQAVI